MAVEVWCVESWQGGVWRVKVRQLRWVKLWCGEVCCGLSGLGSLGKVFSGESCRGVASHGAAWLGSLGESSCVMASQGEVRFGS